MKINTPTIVANKTHGGAKAARINQYQQLRRSVLACFLWENNFYEDGQDAIGRIKTGIEACKPEQVSALAIEARTKFKLRHVPLLIVREMLRHDMHRPHVAKTLTEVIQRPDELGEFLALYFKDSPWPGAKTSKRNNGKGAPIPAQVKKGLAAALTKFNEYQLSKWNSDGAIKLKDVLFLTHAKPRDTAQADLWKRLVDGKLTTPDTWEVELSSSKDKKASWTRLLKENKLGAMALVRNLRNMETVKVDHELINEALYNMRTERVLPFRFIAAAKHAPRFEKALESAMVKCLNSDEKLPGKTVLIIDVSGSMNSALSGRSEITRLESAAALSILAVEMCENSVIYATAGNDYTRIHSTKLLPSRHGFAMRDTIYDSMNKLGGGGIFLAQCMDYVYDQERNADRIVVFTDEQDCDTKLNPAAANAFGDNNYLVNVSNNANGIGYGKWTHIDGFSEATLDYIRAIETQIIQ